MNGREQGWNNRGTVGIGRWIGSIFASIREQREKVAKSTWASELSILRFVANRHSEFDGFGGPIVARSIHSRARQKR